MENKIIDFNKFRTQKAAEREAELDELAAEVDAMDMDAVIRYKLGMEGGSQEAMQHYLETMERVHDANLKMRD